MIAIVFFFNNRVTINTHVIDKTLISGKYVVICNNNGNIKITIQCTIDSIGNKYIVKMHQNDEVIYSFSFYNKNNVRKDIKMFLKQYLYHYHDNQTIFNIVKESRFDRNH